MSPASAHTPNFSRPLPSPFAMGEPSSPPAAAQDDSLANSSTMTNMSVADSLEAQPPSLADDLENSSVSISEDLEETPASVQATSASLAVNFEDTPVTPAQIPEDTSALSTDNPEESSFSPDTLEDEPASPPPVAKDAKYTALASPLKPKVWQRILALSKGREKNPPQDLTLLSNEIGNMDKPIMEFRPQLFPSLDSNRPVLNIDLFWPIKAEDMDDAEEINDDGDQKGVFPFKELKPLVTFRNLHVLELHGMMRSYQPIIWETCFVNPSLSKLTLEMGLEPEFNDDFKTQYTKIDASWSFNRKIPRYEEPTEYLGFHGTGELHPEFGSGEYLDRNAMKQAQAAVKDELKTGNMRYLPVKNLTLGNFAIDAGPFFRFFDPKALKEVTLKGTCWDAGFYLPNEMREVVAVRGPQGPKLDVSALPASLQAAMAARGIGPGELKVVTLSKGKVVKWEAWDGVNHLLPDAPAAPIGESSVGGGVGGGGGGKGLKNKVSQMLGRKAT